jgi:hypothetical protein
MFSSKQSDILNYLTNDNEYLIDISLLFTLISKILPHITQINDIQQLDVINTVDSIDVILSDAINEDRYKRGGCKLLLCMISSIVNHLEDKTILSSYLSI